jgi:hypothetical protein
MAMNKNPDEEYLRPIPRTDATDQSRVDKLYQDMIAVYGKPKPINKPIKKPGKPIRPGDPIKKPMPIKPGIGNKPKPGGGVFKPLPVKPGGPKPKLPREQRKMS